MSEKSICYDGCTATAQACYKFINFSCVFPITPSSPMAEYIEQYAAQGKKNLLNEAIVVKQAQSELGAIGCCHGAAVNGALTATFTCSQGLLLMISNLYHIAGERLPVVVHIANRSVGAMGTSLATDHSDLYSIEGTNMCVIQSCNVQEAYDMTVVAHASAIKGQAAFVHSFEGYRVSHQLESLTTMKDEELMQFLDMEAYMHWRNNGVVSTDRPYAQNAGHGTEIHMQLVESQKYDFDQIPKIVQGYFDKLHQLTGRRYNCYEYVGHPQAETVLVLMGTGSSTVELVVKQLQAEGKKVGVVRIRLFRPFCWEMFAAVFPKSVKVVVCLDRAPEFTQAGGTIYRDTMVALMKADRLNGVKVCGGRYSFLGCEIQPRHVLEIVNAYYEQKDISKMDCEFVVGILDDLRNKSLPRITQHQAEELEAKLLPASVNQSLLYGIGSDGTIGAARNAVQILQNTATNIQVQCNFAFDGKKSGGLTLSNIRLYKGDDVEIKRKVLTAEYDVVSASYIACHCESYLRRYRNMFKQLKNNGIAVLNVDSSESMVDYAERTFPAEIKKELAMRNAQLYMINANRVAIDVGLPGRTNNILILFYFKFGMTGLIDFNDAVLDMKNAAVKTYAKRGQAVIDANIKAIDQSVAMIDQCRVQIPAHWKDIQIEGEVGKLSPYGIEYDSFMKTYIDPIVRRDFEHIGTKLVHKYNNGFVPPNYSVYEKQCSATNVPHWNHDDCIQCNMCSNSCPHTAIRPFVVNLESDIGKTVPKTVPLLDYKGPTAVFGSQPDKTKFTIQVTPADCRGCEVCSVACPKKCLVMKPLADEIKSQQDNFEWCHANLIDTQGQTNIDGMTANMKELMLKDPQFEYAGSCPGCPESAILKLLTQICGDSLNVTAAIGCSYVWAQYTLQRPFTTNVHGRGIPSSASLFEDGSVFHWGSHIGRENIRANMLEFLKKNVDKIGWDAKLKVVVQKVIDSYTDRRNSWKAVDELRQALDLKIYKEGAKNDNVYLGSLEDKELKISPDQATYLVKVTRGEAELTKESFLNYFKLNNLLFTAHSNWYFAGDGAMFDIDFNGVDHILAKGDDVNIVVFCNQVFSNTGGQLSKNSFLGMIAKNAYGGVDSADKQFGLMMVSAYGKNIYVAQSSMGYNRQQLIKSFREAESFHGPSIILVYAPCINHMINGGLKNSEAQQKLVVETGVWPVFRWNGAAERGKRMTIDYQKKTELVKFVENEQRFMALKARDPARFEALQAKLADGVEEVERRLQAMKDL